LEVLSYLQNAETKQKDVLQQLEEYSKGDKAFVIGTNYLLELVSNAVELFTYIRSKLEQKRYLLNFIVATTIFDGEN